jgi:uncharacterized protein (TIGR00730 family)
MSTVTVTVFCGAARPCDPSHLQLARQLGRQLARRRIRLRYGGAQIGVMGVLADAVLAGGGHVTGIITDALDVPGIAHPALTGLEVVPDTAARTARMTAGADGIIALPGGLGTLDELTSVWIAGAADPQRRPVGLLNPHGFFNPLLDLLRGARDAGYLGNHAGLAPENLWIADHDPARLLDAVLARAAQPLTRTP